MVTLIRFLLRHRVATCVALLLSLGASAYASRSIEFRFQFRDFFDYPGNPHLPAFKRDNEVFGDPAGYVVAMIEADDVFRRDVLKYVDELTKRLEPDPTFSRVRSLTNVNSIRGRGDDVLTGALIPNIEAAPEELAETKRFVLQSPLLRRRLVSEDATTTAVLAEMRVPAAFAPYEEQARAIEQVKQALNATKPPPGVRARVTGAPAIESGTTSALMADQLILVPIVCVVLAAMLALTFRSVHGVLLCLAPVSIAMTWTIGIFALFGRPVDIVASVIPTTMLVYAAVDPIFVLSRFFRKLDHGLEKDEAIVATFRELALPCFLTSLATSVGFAGFITCVAPTVRYYGVTVAIGVLLAFVTTVLVLPVVLSLVPLPRKRFASSGTAHWLTRLSLALAQLTRRYPRQLAALSLVLLAVGGWYSHEQRIDNTYIGNLPRGQTRDDVQAFEQKLTGVVRLNVSLEGAAGSMTRPEVVQRIAELDRAIERRPGVTLSSSLPDLLAEANQAFEGGAPEARRVPQSATLLDQYLSLLDPRDRDDFVTTDYSRSQIAVLLEDRGSAAMRAMSADVEQLLAASGLQQLGIRSTVTGHGVVAFREGDRIVIELLYGFIFAFLAVVALEWVLFRSLRAALLSIVPNLIPMVVCFSFTRWMGIPLRFDTILVLCVSIGGLFNTTIHFVARVQQQLAEGKQDPDAIVAEAITAITPPSLFTATILSVGFAVFMLSHFSGLQTLGLLSMITLFSGFVSDVLFTPALMRLGYAWNPRKAPANAPLALERGVSGIST